jgi:hypothetical protein
MTMTNLFSLWPAQLGRAVRKYRVMLAIRRTQRHIEHIGLGIATAQALRSDLRAELSALKAEQRSL